MSFRITRTLSPLGGPSAGSGNRRPAAWLLRGTENCGDKSRVCVRGVSDASEIPARRKRERRKIRAATAGRRAEEDEEKADTWAATTTS